MENLMFFIMQQHMKQQDKDKAAREYQLMLAWMERETTERDCKEHEVQCKCCHQCFMITMMMVTGRTTYVPIPP
eukprot:3550199-Ditylum_brightwellii.AAC.1